MKIRELVRYVVWFGNTRDEIHGTSRYVEVAVRPGLGVLTRVEKLARAVSPDYSDLPIGKVERARDGGPTTFVAG